METSQRSRKQVEKQVKEWKQVREWKQVKDEAQGLILQNEN